MPRFRYEVPSQSEEYTLLFDRLVAEIGQPSKDRRKAEAEELELREGQPPLIFEDPDRRTRRFGVTVLWEDWKNIDLQERGGMILDAYRKAKGEEEMLRINRALGLTQAEADRLGLRF